MIQFLIAAAISNQAQVTPPEPAYLIKTGAIVITDRTDRDDLKKIFAARTKDEAEALLENGAFEYRIVEGRYEIWLSNYFPMRVAQKKIAKLQDVIQRGPQNVGFLNLAEYKDLIAESLVGLLTRDNFPNPGQFGETSGGLSYSKVFTLQRSDGTIKQISMPSAVGGRDINLPEVPAKSDSRQAESQVFRRLRSTQWTIATSSMALNSVETTQHMADMLRYLVSEQAELDKRVTDLVMALHEANMLALRLQSEEDYGGKPIDELDENTANQLKFSMRIEDEKEVGEWRVLGYETVPVLVFKLGSLSTNDGGTVYDFTTVRLDNPAWKSKYNRTSDKP